MFQTLDRNLMVAPQLTAADIGAAARAGIRTVICNRPDGEEAGQPAAAELAEAARAAGIRWIHQPLTMSELDADRVRAFADALRDNQEPVLAFCRTGTRSAALWAAYRLQQGATAEHLTAAAAAAGIDLSAVLPKLTALAVG